MFFQVSDRRDLKFQRKIPLKPEICCNFEENLTNPQEKSRKVRNLGKMAQIRG